MPETFAQMFAKAIKGRKQHEVATSLDVTQSRVSRWIRGEGLPNDDAIAGICEALGLDEAKVRRQIARERLDYQKRESPQARLDGMARRVRRIERLLERLAEKQGVQLDDDDDFTSNGNRS